MRFCRIAILLLSIVSPTLAKPAGLQATVCWTYVLTPAPETATINFICLIPRDQSDWQKVTDLRFSHPPVERLNDGDDALARFFFRDVKTPITLTITATVSLKSAGLLNRRPAVGLRLPDADRKSATAPETYIESDDPKVTDLARQIRDGTPAQHLIQIQLLVLKTLKRGVYDAEDHGAAAAIERGTGDCSEYADLFVALCRARNIPARVCEGHTIDAGLLKRNPPHHNWVMVWLDDRGWTRFDPVDVASRMAKHEAQGAWYIQLTNQRISPVLKGHLYRIGWTGAEVTVESKFERIDDR